MRALFVLAALLIGLSPGAALAHGGPSHGDEAQSFSTVERQAWSPICPPGSGHVCACGNLSLCEGSGKPAVLARCSVSFLPLRAGLPVLLPEAPARPSPRFAPNLPRAPPSFA